MEDARDSVQRSLLRLQKYVCMVIGDTWSLADPVHMTLQLPYMVEEWSELQLSLPAR
jgi:hypothetical protein